MVNNTDKNFAAFAGQSIASGISANRSLIAFEKAQTENVFKNIEKINGLMPKIANTMIFETKVYQSPLDRIVNRMDARFGAATEMAMFLDGVPNKKRDGTCIPRGSMTMESILMIQNHSWNLSVDVADEEVSRAVLDDATLGAYVAQKMKGMSKSEARMYHAKLMTLLSDVVDGSRTVVSTDSSDGTGNSVTYSVSDIKGYAGMVDVLQDVKVAPVEVGEESSISAGDALKIYKRIKAICADFKIETDAFNKLGAMTFETAVPNIIMEEKVLNACDDAFADYNLGAGSDVYGFAGIPTKSFREALREIANVIEVDCFASLPTNAEYAGLKIGCLILSPDCLWRIDHWSNIESDRCVNGRLTGYNWQGDATLAMWTGCNSYAMLVDSDDTATYLATFKDSDGQGGAVLGKVRVNSGSPITFTTLPPSAPEGKEFDAYKNGATSFVSGTTTIAADTVFTATYKNKAS